MRRFLLITFLILTFAVPLHAAGIRQKKIKKVPYCNLFDLMSANKLKMIRQLRKSVVFGKNLVCEFPRNQRRMLCNQVRVELLNPTAAEWTTPWLATMDWFKTLRPLLYPATIPKRKITRITIDMGHGGSDPGAIGAISKEKMLTLKIGLRLAQHLRARGYQVFLTRTGDVQIPLKQVGVLQRSHKSDLFVSIHINSAADKKANGIETYCLTPAGAVSSNGGKADKTVYSGNKQDDANILLAWMIQSSLLKYTKANDRGVKRARFAVLKDINAPGVLIEVGFISNPAEEKKLNSAVYVDQIAAGITVGIVNFTKRVKPKKVKRK
ncbi:MAG: N-acetylmuramoyl-L-alanine amidase [Lentisphaerae bacterium]|nr:N-acetylmuramoyl-L-alanine amidase [Lentisphaerota bacterium]